MTGRARGFGRVADRGAGGLGVDGDSGGHLHVGGGVHIDVAVAGAGLNHRDGGVGHHRADEAGPAAGDEDIHVLVELHQGQGGFPGGVLDELDGIGGQAAGAQALPQSGDDGHIGADGFLAAPEDHGVARLDAQGGGVGGDVGAGLINDAHHAQGDAGFLNFQAVGTAVALRHLAHRVIQGGDIENALAHAADAVRGQGEAIQQGGMHPGGLGGGHVLPVGRQDIVGMGGQGSGHGGQGLVLTGGAGHGQQAGGDFGAGADVFQRVHTVTLPFR